MPAAVISDGSALRVGGRDVAADSLFVLLEDDAAGIHARAGVSVWAAPMSARDAKELVVQLRGIPTDTDVIFLTRTEPDRARTAQQAMRNTVRPAVFTDADTTAITLTAAVLTAVAHAGDTPTASRVVIAGSAAMPDLCAPLVAVGIGDINSWNASDGHVFPLRHLARHATVMIDLLGATTRPGG
jgi:hypothetical protein